MTVGEFMIDYHNDQKNREMIEIKRASGIGLMKEKYIVPSQRASGASTTQPKIN